MTQMDLQIGPASDVGHVRSLNQDFISCVVPEDEVQFRNKGALFLVADGMGGHNAGEVASQEAVECVLEAYYADATHDVVESLKRAFEIANQTLCAMAQDDPSKAGMGTTLVAAVIREDRAIIANVGDSRAYLLRGKRLSQITVDHSWVEEQVQEGLLTRDAARRHPHRNLITRSLGTRPGVEVDFFDMDLHRGDRLLLCTDGLSGQVSDQKMAQVVHAMSPQGAAADLVARANAKGGVDNVSVVIVQAGPRSGETDFLPALGSLCAGENRQKWVVGLAALVVFCMCILILGLPLINQRFVGNPVAAPYPAPIHFAGLPENGFAGLAADLGYSSVEELQNTYSHEMVAGDLMEADLELARPGIFVVGLVRNWQCRVTVCEFHLEVAGVVYQFQLDQAFLSSVRSLKGRRIRVFGQRQADGDLWDARLIDLGARWWAWWQPAWVTVLANGDWGETAWVYSVLDQNPYGIVPMGDYPALQQGDRILASGKWTAGNSAESMAFTAAKLYRLDGDVYVAVQDRSAPTPQPTVTLRPTDTQ
jgi:serine/threonine protein phosphatase PrpC